MFSRPLAIAGLALAFASGCNQVDFIEIKPDNLTLRQKNNEIWLQARAMSHTGVHYPRTRIQWAVKDPSIASVDDKGRLTPLKSGQTEVIGTTGDVSSSVPVEVVFAEKMTVTPASLTLKVGGDPVDLRVKVYDYLGRELRDRTPTYRGLDNEVVSMGQNAAFPVNPGSTKVEVRVETLLQTVEVKVEGDKKQIKTAKSP